MLSQAVFIQYRNVTDGQTDSRTDGRTDRIPISISRVSMLTRAKNGDFGPILSKALSKSMENAKIKPHVQSALISTFNFSMRNYTRNKLEARQDSLLCPSLLHPDTCHTAIPIQPLARSVSAIRVCLKLLLL